MEFSFYNVVVFVAIIIIILASLFMKLINNDSTVIIDVALNYLIKYARTFYQL